jgi:type I restriction enzyme M protein
MNPEEDQFFKDLDKRLWTAADKLRSNLDAAVYKHAVLGLIFLKYISDTFDERRAELQAQFRDPSHDYYLGDESMITEELEVRDYYTEKNVFWVPALARWNTIQSSAKLAPGTQITIKNGKLETYRMVSAGRLLDDALEAVERDNPRLRRVLNKDFARLEIDSGKLGQLIDLIATVPFHHESLKARDILGHVYQYFLGQFASAEGKKGGQYYTPKAIVTLIVEMIEPFQGRVYDPCCGSGGFFIQSERFIEAHADQKHYKAEEQRHKIAVYGQESNPTTWRLAAMNLAINAIEYDLGKEWADSFLRDLHPDLRADFIMANPPFNMKEWGVGQLQEDPRWKYGAPPASNANFAWLQHMIYHLAPNGGMGLLLANGSMSSNTNNEGEIRKGIIKADLVECIVALPGQLFTNTQIPACIWFLTRNKAARNGWRDRKGETLFINARNLGYMKDRVTRDFTVEDVDRVAGTFHAWRQGQGYEDIRGFCNSANLAAIEKEDYVLTPGRYVGPEDRVEDTEPFGEKMTRLTTVLVEQFTESARLEKEIKKNLAGLGFLPKEPGYDL